MDDQTLNGVIRPRIEQAVNYWENVFGDSRIKAFDYYQGNPLGNEISGRSHMVSRDVAEAVDTLMPSLLRVFTSIDEPVRFNANKPQDEAYAEQATDYANFIWNVRNAGFKNFYEWFKAALLFRIGVLKVWWDDTPECKKEVYKGVNDIQYQAISLDPDIDILEEEIYPDPEALAHIRNQVKAGIEHAILTGQPPPSPPQIDPSQLPQLRNLTVSRTIADGRIRIKAVPSEEFLFDQFTTDQDDAPFMCHRQRMSKSDLRLLGIDEDIIESLSADEPAETALEEKRQRFVKESYFPYSQDNINDPSSQGVWVYECYLKIDCDGDGIAEYRKITVAGEKEYTVIGNDEVDNHPFAVITPLPLPFKMVGQSIYDQTKDIQDVKSTLWRQMLDNFYLTTHTRYVTGPGVNRDDVLNPRPGQPIRAKNPATDIVALGTLPIGQEALAAIEYVDTVRESRTGVTRHNQGLNSDELNPTATGVQLIMDAGNMRMEAIARNFAETGVKRAFKRILELASKHQTRQEIVKLRGTWVPIKPTEWDASYEVTVSVGLGTGNRDSEFARLMQMMQLNAQALVMQKEAGFPDGPIVTMKNVYNMLRRVAEVAGIKNPDQYYTDPTQALEQHAQQQAQKPQGPPPDPKAEAQKQIAAQQLQEKQREFDTKHAFDQQRTAAEQALDRDKLDQEGQIDRARIAVDAGKALHNMHTAGHQAGLGAAADLMSHAAQLANQPPNNGAQ